MSAGQQAVPANNANNASNEGAQKKHMSKAAVAIIAVVVVAIIVVAGVFGFRAYSDAQYNNAVAACAAASENVRNATNDYNNLVNGDASEAAALTKKDVKDASTLDALNKELSVELPVYEGCVADDTAGFKSATAKLNEQADLQGLYSIAAEGCGCRERFQEVSEHSLTIVVKAVLRLRKAAFAILLNRLAAVMLLH